MLKTLDGFFKNGRNKDKLNSKTVNLFDIDKFKDEDWTFKRANTKEFTHAIFNEYPARMIPQIARKLIKKYYPYEKKDQKKPILDPFGGSGTTAVEALLQNIDSIIFDLNPFANLLEKVKTAVINPILIRKYSEKILNEIKRNKSKIFPEFFPNMNIDYWYNKNVKNELSIIIHAIEIIFPENNIQNDIELVNLKDFFKVCLAKTARNCSYQRSGEHKTYRIPKNKISEFDRNVNAIKYFKEIIKSFKKASNDLYFYYRDNKISAKCIPNLANSINLDGIEKNSIDMIITSPPYGDSQTTVAYGQFSRFPLEWLGIDHNSIIKIDSNLLGGVEKESESILTYSPLLFNIIKKILCEEVKQQNSLIEIFFTENEITYKKFYDLVERFKDFHLKVNLIINPEEFIQLKNDYFGNLKDLRKIINNINRIPQLKEKKPIFPKIKIIQSRTTSVLSFFEDFYKVFQRLFEVLDNNRKCCIVIGNRTIRKIQIPTDKIIIELGKTLGFKHIKTYYREIPNKRMPKKNSPSNIRGKKSLTIEKESIIIFNK
ncbi:MAG: DNA methyltransferase [Promethearchaeota archaeon]